MASNKIKGITVEIGGDTTKLGNAIGEVEKKTSSLKGELQYLGNLSPQKHLFEEYGII